MKIVDSFLFSEPYEKEVLLTKMILGNQHTAEWIIVEGAYTFQGEYKGLHAQNVIDSDERFAPFRSRIHVITTTVANPALDYTRKDIDKQGMDSERRQRSLAREYIIGKYADDVWVLLSDSDEMLDLGEPEKQELLQQKIEANTNGLIFVPRRRFWYDFDNLWNAVRSTPLVTVAQIRAAKGDMGLGFLRSDHIGYADEWPQTLVFEYSYCYGYENILRKFRTFPHGGMTETEIRQSTRCNHIPISAFRKMKLDLHKPLWMEKVTLTPQNSPRYVRENLELLRTNSIDPNYSQNRLADYPHLFTAQHKALFLIKQTAKKIKKVFLPS